MTMLIWRILGAVSLVVCILCIVLVLALRLLKNGYYHEYTEDELLKTKKAANSKSSCSLYRWRLLPSRHP